MADGRIRGRKVLVGGGWGQLAARRPPGCCGGRFRPCLALIRKCCGCGKGQVKATNQVVDYPAVTELPLYATSPERAPNAARGAWTEDQLRATVESPNVARVDTGELRAKEKSGFTVTNSTICFVVCCCCLLLILMLMLMLVFEVVWER